MKKMLYLKMTVVAACTLALLFLGGCGARQNQETTGGHGDRKVGCDS